jgi:hypothetical protein
MTSSGYKSQSGKGAQFFDIDLLLQHFNYGKSTDFPISSEIRLQCTLAITEVHLM